MAFSIRVLCVAKPRDMLCEATDHYASLLSPHVDMRVEFCRPVSASAGPVRTGRLSDEERRLISRWQPGSYPVALAREGGQKDSEGLARWIDRHRVGGSRLVFNIGGAYGLSDGFKGRCKETLSLSKMTLSHSLARVVLLEQLYRAFSILRGHPYHK